MKHPAVFEHLAAAIPAQCGVGGGPFHVVPHVGLQSLQRGLQPLVDLIEQLITLLGPCFRPYAGVLDGLAAIVFCGACGHQPRVGVDPRIDELLHIAGGSDAHHAQRLVSVADSQPAHLAYQGEFQQCEPRGCAVGHGVVPPVGWREAEPHGAGQPHILVDEPLT